MSDRKAEAPLICHRVTDGDTVRVGIGFRLPMRLKGIDAPELSIPAQHAAALVAQAHARLWLLDAERAEEKPGSKMAVMVRVDDLGLYKRVEGDVYRTDTGETLTGYLLACGVAVKSEDGRRHKWTDEELRRIEQLAP